MQKLAEGKSLFRRQDFAHPSNRWIDTMPSSEYPIATSPDDQFLFNF
jgi:hypothetical protein